MPWEQILVTVMGSLRAAGIVMALPTLGGRPLPPMIRVALAISMGGLLASAVPAGATPMADTMPALAAVAVHEMLLGLAMGLVMRTVFATAELTGRMIAGEIGLMAAPGFDVPVPAQEPVPSFIGIFAGMLFFIMRGHEAVLAAFARSFIIAPAGTGGLSTGATETVVGAVSTLLELALRMAAPFIALNFVITLGFAILGRAVPKMNVFVLSYALRSLFGFMLLAGAGALFARYLASSFEQLPWKMLELVARRG
jgi:flagellar biosynthetic protein FliR